MSLVDGLTGLSLRTGSSERCKESVRKGERGTRGSRDGIGTGGAGFRLNNREVRTNLRLRAHHVAVEGGEDARRLRGDGGPRGDHGERNGGAARGARGK